jgi:hypothetical protein
MFFNLRTLYHSIDDIEDIQIIKQYLKYLETTDYNNNNIYDIINYEKLIYIFVNFQDNEEIMNSLEIIFNKIANNYNVKRKLREHLILH